MTGGASELLIRKLERRDHLDDEERTALSGCIAREEAVALGEDIVREGDRPRHSTLLLDGFVGRYKMLRDGGRQITALHVPGDFVDLHSFLLKRLDHGIVALTPCRTAIVPHERLSDVTSRFPHLTRMLWLSTLLDGAVHREWIVAMGRRSATGRMAHLVCELYLRLEAVGQTEHSTFALPLTQAQVADVVGCSVVHANRLIQELRRLKLIQWRGGTLVILNWPALTELAEFDPTYLNLEHEPR